jgi:hypothetical protein
MSLYLAIAINAIFAVGLLGGLAWMMSHPRRLVAHEPAAENVEVINLRGTSVEVERRAA